MHTLRIFTLFILFPFFFTTKAQTVYDPNAQVRSVPGFTAVHVGGSIDLYITTTSENAVAVSAKDAAVLADITTEVKNGELYIGMKNGHRSTSSEDIKAYVSAKTLNKLGASGASNIYVNGELQSTDLYLSLSGASDFKGKVNVQNLRLSASGSSDFTISGKTVNLQIDLSGSSDVKGYELTSDNCDIEGSGASDVRITVNKAIKARLSGACDVAYRGDAAVQEVRASGASSVKKAGMKD